MMRPSEPPLTVWFDGACPLCSREMAWLKRQTTDAGVSYVDITTSPSLPNDAQILLARLHAQETGGPMLSGAAAFAALWRRSIWLRPLGLAGRSPLVLAALDRLYGFFIQIRPRLQILIAGSAGRGRS